MILFTRIAPPFIDAYKDYFSEDQPTKGKLKDVMVDMALEHGEASVGRGRIQGNEAVYKDQLVLCFARGHHDAIVVLKEGCKEVTSENLEFIYGVPPDFDWDCT